MSEDKMEHQEDLKAASRRSRKDQQGRDYVCGCGKRYLSYPALYTHIKTKHHGQQPEGTQKTGVPPMNRKPKSSVNDKILKQIQSFVRIQNLNILTYLDENAQGSIPLMNRIRKQNLPKQFIQAFQAILKSTTPIILDKKTPIQIILVCYLIGVGQFCSETMFVQYYCAFAKHFRSCFRDYLQEVYQSCFKHEDVRKDRVISVQECYLAPIICDFFLRFYIPYEKKQPDFQAAMDLISYDFCRWMFEHKLTIVQVGLKKVCQIRRNLIQPKKLQPKKSENDNQNENQIQHQKQSQSQNQNQQDHQNQQEQQQEPQQQQQQCQQNQQQNQHQPDEEQAKKRNQQKQQHQQQKQKQNQQGQEKEQIQLQDQQGQKLAPQQKQNNQHHRSVNQALSEKQHQKQGENHLEGRSQLLLIQNNQNIQKISEANNNQAQNLRQVNNQ